jgi:hypothetical protein
VAKTKGGNSGLASRAVGVIWMIARVGSGESDARDAGDECDDEPSQSEIVRSLRQEYEAQVARWAQISVRQVQDYQQVQRSIAASIAAGEAAAASFTTAVDACRALSKRIPDFVVYAERGAQHRDALLKSIAEVSAVPDLGSVPVGYYPPNWWSVAKLDGDVAIAIMQEEGIPLAWVPRAEIVADLIAAPDPDARDTILVARTQEIVEDCRRRLAEVLDADLQDLNGLTGDAGRALEQSNPTAAQALAANVFDTLLRDVRHRGRLFAGSTGRFKYQHVTSGITPVSEETLIGVYRATCVLTPVLKALAEFNVETDPVPGRFTRHATAHRAGTTQYTPPNAIIAIMLATSLLREAQESGW